MESRLGDLRQSLVTCAKLRVTIREAAKFQLYVDNKRKRSGNAGISISNVASKKGKRMVVQDQARLLVEVKLEVRRLQRNRRRLLVQV